MLTQQFGAIRHIIPVASSPGRSQLHAEKRFSTCNVEELGVAWGRGYYASTRQTPAMP